MAIRTARNGGLTSCGVLWGFRGRAELEAEGYIYSVAGRGSFVSAGDGEHLRRIAELTGRLVPLLEELKSLGYTREQLLVLWEGGEGK